MIHEIRPDLDRKARIRRIFGRTVRSHLEAHEEGIVGFAIVTWDVRGEAHTSYLTETGPIGRALMPLYVKDVLDRHVTVNVAETAAERITGEG